MDAEKQIQSDAETITNLYSNLESQIFTEIIKVLQRGKYADVTADNVLQWQVKQLADAGMLFDGVIKLLAEYDHLDPDYIRQTLQDDGHQILDEISQELQEHGQPAQPISDDLESTLDSAVRQTTDTLNNTINQTLLSRNLGVNPAMRVYQEILKRSMLATVSGLKTHEQAIKDAIYQQVERGIPILRDKAGRIWSIEGYTRTVLTTTANRIYNDLRTKRMQEMGQVLCVMTSHPNSREACAYIQGQVVNVVPPEDPKFNGKYGSIYNHGYGTPAGTLGINCRHMLIPYTEGVNTNHQPQYDPEEAIKNGKLVQQQRARERAIRDAKKRLEVAEQLGDQVMIDQTKTLLRARQAKLREFIKVTNADRKVPILTRDYAREQIIRTAPRDYMAKKQAFKILIPTNKVSHVHTKQVRGYRAEVWSEGSSKKYRATIENVNQALMNYNRQVLPKVVITDSKKLGRHSAAAYNHGSDALFVNSDILQNTRSVANYLKGDYFAASNINDIIRHEMTHKQNWDKAREEYRLHPNKYRDVDDAINQLNEPVFNYAKHLTYDDPRLFGNSHYLRDTMFHHKSREVVAELNVLDISDDTLHRMLKEVLA